MVSAIYRLFIRFWRPGLSSSHPESERLVCFSSNELFLPNHNTFRLNMDLLAAVPRNLLLHLTNSVQTEFKGL